MRILVNLAVDQQLMKSSAVGLQWSPNKNTKLTFIRLYSEMRGKCPVVKKVPFDSIKSVRVLLFLGF